jgi:phosphoglucosamine mutase
MGKQLFGTDGIRGVAGEAPLDAGTVYACGVALGKDLIARRNDNERLPEKPEVVIGMDTRESGPAIASQFAGGLADAGVTARFAGLITTPGVAWLTRSTPFDAGVMISASHNPYRDNGIKIFASTGYKLPDTEEHLIEEDIFRTLEAGPRVRTEALTVDPGLDSKYLANLFSILSTPLNGMRLVLDCGNGAASHLAPDLFCRAGANITVLNNQPDGRNINLNCGALHVESLRAEVLRLGADGGVAFDGDADRAILVSASGKIVDGDAVLLISARSLKALGHLAHNLVVSTVMSNLGLERALTALGIDMVRTPVGDKYVLEEMIRSGAVLGGEQSGHVIFGEYSTTGDGMLTALKVFEIARQAGMSLDALTADLEIYPQLLVNVRVIQKRKLDQLPEVKRHVATCEAEFGDKGRVLVRFSGTEPLARVMVEGPDTERVGYHANRIADAIRAELS